MPLAHPKPPFSDNPILYPYVASLDLPPDSPKKPLAEVSSGNDKLWKTLRDNFDRERWKIFRALIQDSVNRDEYGPAHYDQYKAIKAIGGNPKAWDTMFKITASRDPEQVQEINETRIALYKLITPLPSISDQHRPLLINLLKKHKNLINYKKRLQEKIKRKGSLHPYTSLDVDINELIPYSELAESSLFISSIIEDVFELMRTIQIMIINHADY